MKKDFPKWHTKKARVNDIEPRPFFHEREIWWCILGVNVGSEQDGGGRDFLRPVIIFRKFNNEIFWAIPLTRLQKKTEHYFVFLLESGASCTAILSQVRLVDARRLSHRLGEIALVDFVALNNKFKALLP